MRATLIVLGIVALSACAPASTVERASASAPTGEIGCAAFPAALRACAPASCSQPHIFVPSFTIQHRITVAEDGACAYSQTMPGEMNMTCRLSEAGRNEFASEMANFQRTGDVSFSFSSANPTPDTTMTRECEIRDRDGTVIPWGTSQR